MPPGGDDNELPAVLSQAVGHWRRLTAGRQPSFPQLLAGFQVDRPQLVIERRADEHEPALCHDWPAEVWGTPCDRERNGCEIPDSSQGNFPLHFAGSSVDRQQRAPGWLVAGQLQGGKKPGSAVQAVGCALQRANLGAVRHVRLSRSQRLSRNEAGERRQVAHVKDHPTPLRLKCDAPPIRSADHAWVLDRPSQARRCEDAVVAMALDQFLALALIPGAEPPSVIATERGWC